MSRPSSRSLAAALAVLAFSLSLAAGAQAVSQRPRLAISAPDRLRQGDPLLAWIVSVGPASGPQDPPLELRLSDAAGKAFAKARCFDASSLLDSRDARLYGAMVGLPVDMAAGSYTLSAGPAGQAPLASVALAVEARAYPLEVIPLDGANSEILATPSKRKDDEAKSLYAILAKVDAGAIFATGSTFIFPADSGAQSAGFGDKRRYDYAKGGSSLSVHAGIDWAVPKSSVVRACDRGKVVLVADRDVTGTTVVLEHLPGLYSLYFHLSFAGVKEGDIVERGQGIALSGSTGLSTGPHLHWEIRARGDAVDPLYWRAAPLLDKEAIKARITALIEGR